MAIPNAVTLLPQLSESERTAVRQTIVGDATRPLIIAVGRLMAQKGYFDLLSAMDQVRQTQPDATLLIVGQGVLQASLEAEIEKRDLQNHVYLLGARKDVPQLLGASDIYVSSSHWEGLSNALLEAMSVGLPVVATAVNDTPNVVKEGTGLLVPAHQPDQLAKALNQLLVNKDQRIAIGQAARNHIANTFDPAIWVKQMLSLYQSVLPFETNPIIQEQTI